jgi:murein DD-endopeptidase MepM/ murein hydrolase activator NlpD
VPVAGVEPRACESSFGAPRSEHRTHEGIDIFAKKGTPVVAATDGEVLKVGHDRLGGNVISVAGEGLNIYYYAHLDRVRPDLKAGQIVRAGEPLGTVGNTGNARTTPAHLHFGVYSATRAFCAVDPAPMLQHQGRTIAYTPPPPPAKTTPSRPPRPPRARTPKTSPTR